jgi:hypothetical protein
VRDYGGMIAVPYLRLSKPRGLYCVNGPNEDDNRTRNNWLHMADGKLHSYHLHCPERWVSLPPEDLTTKSGPAFSTFKGRLSRNTCHLTLNSRDGLGLYKLDVDCMPARFLSKDTVYSLTCCVGYVGDSHLGAKSQAVVMTIAM